MFRESAVSVRSESSLQAHCHECRIFICPDYTYQPAASWPLWHRNPRALVSAYSHLFWSGHPFVNFPLVYNLRTELCCCCYYFFKLELGWHSVAAVHIHTNSTQNTEDGTHVKITKKQNLVVNWEVWAVTRLCELYPGICLTTEEKARKNPRVVEKCPDIPVAVVQYTFTHKQYTEQHSKTKYTERNIHNNKST
jgi:hypothetical protein